MSETPPQITESLRLVVEHARAGRLPADPAAAYHELYANFILAAVQGSIDIETFAHHYAGVTCALHLAGHRILKLEGELKAIRETFNLPTEN